LGKMIIFFIALSNMMIIFFTVLGNMIIFFTAWVT
jgi:hypothetical protein